MVINQSPDSSEGDFIGNLNENISGAIVRLLLKIVNLNVKLELLKVAAVRSTSKVAGPRKFCFIFFFGIKLTIFGVQINKF